MDGLWLDVQHGGQLLDRHQPLTRFDPGFHLPFLLRSKSAS
jgi:hypothetical protein